MREGIRTKRLNWRFLAGPAGQFREPRSRRHSCASCRRRCLRHKYANYPGGVQPEWRATLRGSDLFGHDVGSAIGAAEQAIGFFVVDDFLLLGIESQGAA